MQQHKPTTSSTCDATPRALDPEAAPGVPGLWRKRDLSETAPASVTHQLRVRPFLSAPCTFRLAPLSVTRFETWPYSPARVSRTHERPVNCKLSTLELNQPIHHHLEPPGVELVDHALRTKMFVRTLPPASRLILSAAVSTGNPLRPRTPATAHADRWWPRTPMTAAPANVRVSGTQTTEKQHLQNLRFQSVTRLVGKLTNGAEGPPFDFKSAM